MPISAVVFDLDGTLVHSAPDLHAAANRMLSDFGLQTVSLDQIISFVGEGVPKLVERCLAAVDASNTPQDRALASFREHYLANPYALTEPYPGVVDLLEALQTHEIALGICTNKPIRMTNIILDGLGLSSFFQVVIGGDSLPVRKPSPQPLLNAFDALEVDAEFTLYVGDSEVDAGTAEAAGVSFALFEGGYRKAPADGLQAQYVFDNFPALKDYILKG